MIAFYYRAYDEVGLKRSGTIEAPDRRTADRLLRRQELRPYFLEDWRALRKAIVQKRRRQRLLAIGGAVAVLCASVLSGAMVRYAGRERALGVDDIKRIGPARAQGGMVDTQEQAEQEFAQGIKRMWDSFCPKTVTDIDATVSLMIVYVNRNIDKLTAEEVELIAGNSLKSLSRRFEASVCTLLLVEKDDTLLEMTYNAITRSTRVKWYR